MDISALCVRGQWCLKVPANGVCIFLYAHCSITHFVTKYISKSRIDIAGGLKDEEKNRYIRRKRKVYENI